MLVSSKNHTLNGKNVTVKVYKKNTKYVRYSVRGTVIKITIPNALFRNGQADKYIEQMYNKAIQYIDYGSDNTNQLAESKNYTILGDHYTVVRNSSYDALDISNKTIFITNTNLIENKNIKKQINKFYLSEIESRVNQINQATINKPYRSVNLKNNTSTWGFCTHDNHLTFSTNLLFFPLWVIDYVIVHELCHIIEKNHSVKFWNLVSIYYPKYRDAKAYLKENKSNIL